jgi:hypothetical protein
VTVRCHTSNSCLLSGGAPDSPVRISFLIWRSRPLQLRAGWRTRHCPVHTGLSGAHRTVRCPQPTVGAPTRRARIARPTVGAVDRWITGQSGAPPDSPVNFSRTPLNVSRERRLRRGRLTGQSGAPPDSPVIYSRTPPSSSESGLFTETGLTHRTLSGAPPDTVRCTTGLSGAPRPSRRANSFPIAFLLSLALRNNTLVPKSIY